MLLALLMKRSVFLLYIWNQKDCGFFFAAGLFEVRAQEYLETLPTGEQSGVNKFLKGLGKMPEQPLSFHSGCVACYS